MRLSFLVATLLGLSAPAYSQEPTSSPGQPETAASRRDEARAAELRRTTADALTLGELERAYTAIRQATELTEDPTVWLELADVADRLRVDGVALSAYQAYLSRVPASARRAEIEARVEVLTHVVHGGRYIPRDEGRTVQLLVDWDGRPHPRRRSGATEVLVDWQGRPLVVHRGVGSPPLAPWPQQASSARGGLGSALSVP